MSETRELTCINCPLGCALSVTIDGSTITVTGNTCPRGEAYGLSGLHGPAQPQRREQQGKKRAGIEFSVSHGKPPFVC